MHISNIKLKNFRIFKDLDLQLNKGLNVLVGENSSGKTAIIDAIRYALGTNSNDRTYINDEDFHNDSSELIIQLTFSNLEKHAYRFVEHLSYKKNDTDTNTDPIKENVLYVTLKAQKTSIEKRGYPYIKTELKSGKDGNGLSIEPEIRNFLSATYLKPLRDAQSELSSGRASRLSQILSSSKNIKSDIQKILEIVAKANDELLDDKLALKKSAENIQNNYLYNLIFAQDKSKFSVFINIAGIQNSILGSLSPTQKSGYVRQILEGLSLALSENRSLHGLGYHNLLFMATELLLLEQEEDNEFPLLLIEEPEAHLHPQLQLKLLQFIKSKVDLGKVQCFLTTNSPNISSKVSPTDIIMLNNGNAFSLRLGETEAVEEDYRFLEKFLDATKANIFFAKNLLFVEGVSENILLPTIAKLLAKPLEDYAVSIVQYGNSGSWKRFARLFLKKGKDDASNEWNPTKVCILSDLDLWPECAEKKENNAFGFKKRTDKNKQKWLNSDNNNDQQINQRKKDIIDGLERQNIKVEISNDWTLEFCLAKHGLFEECCEALELNNNDKEKISKASDDEKATYILKKAKKTDFAYNLAVILEKQFESKKQKALDELAEDKKKDAKVCSKTLEKTRMEFALELKDKLPSYIVDAIEYVTSPIDSANNIRRD